MAALKRMRSYTRSNSNSRLGAVERDILAELSLGELLYVHLASARSTKRVFKLAREIADRKYRRKRSIAHLSKLGYIAAHGDRLFITEKGLQRLNGLAQKTRSLLQSTTWDHKWRIATYDIPEKYRVFRNKVRSILRTAGFVQLQQSVWVFPHECTELVELIKRESRLSQYILYGVLERIEDEARLKALFKL